MMHISIIWALFFSVVSAIWPVPIAYSEGVTTVVLADGFTIKFNGPNGTPPDGYVDTSERVWGAINRTYDLLNDGFVPYMLYPFEQNFEPLAEELDASQQLTELVITQTF